MGRCTFLQATVLEIWNLKCREEGTVLGLSQVAKLDFLRLPHAKCRVGNTGLTRGLHPRACVPTPEVSVELV